MIRRARKEPNTLDVTRTDRLLATHWPFTVLLTVWFTIGVWAALNFGADGMPLILLGLFGTVTTSMTGGTYLRRNGYRRGYLRGLEPTGVHGSPEHAAHFKAIKEYR